MNSRLTTCVTGCCPAHTKYKTIYASLEVADGAAGKILFRHDHGVNHVDNAVALIYIADGYLRRIAFLIL
jgi:hypothetical protein